MKIFITLFFLVSLNLFALEQAIVINRIEPAVINPGDKTEINILGSGFFPASIWNDPNGKGIDLKNRIQIQYRQIYPKMGGLNNAILSRSIGRTFIYQVGPNKINLAVDDLAKQPNTTWSFEVCILNVGCSNPAILKIYGPGASHVSLLSGNSPVDIAAVNDDKNLVLQPRGLSSQVAILRLGANGSLYGHYDLDKAHFILPKNLINHIGILNAMVEDPMSGETSESFMIRVFSRPNLTSGPVSIIQNLNWNQNIQDVEIELQFYQMTFPSTIQFKDGANILNFNPSLDLITNKAKIKIPASALKIGKYSAELILNNIAGTVTHPINIEINKTIITPVPGPGPGPIPGPRPTPVPSPIPRPPR